MNHTMKENLEKEGFELIASVNNFYPNHVQSGIYSYKSVFYNESTGEIKALFEKTVRSTKTEEKEIPLDDIRDLAENNPVRVALEILESDSFKNNKILLEEVKKLSKPKF